MHKMPEEIPLEEITYTPETKLDADLALKPDEKPKKSHPYLYFVAAIANLLAFATGSAIGWPIPVIPQLERADNPLGRVATSSETAWIAGLLALGATTAPLISKFVDKIGRKKMLLLLACLQGVALVMSVCAKTVSLYYVGRVVAGVSTGTVYPVLSMYLAEISENHNRGTLACSMSIFVSVGLNFSLMVGPYLTIPKFCLVSLIPLLIFLVAFLVLAPESPLFLASIKDEKGLANTLLKLRNKTTADVHEEMTTMLEGVNQNKVAKSGIRSLVMSKASRKGLIISVGLVLLQQSSGYGGIVSYMPRIFSAAGGTLSPAVATMIIGSFQVIGTIMSSVVVDRAGRRILLLISSIGMSCTLVLLGLHFYLKDNAIQVEWLSWLPVVTLTVFIIAFSIGLGPVPWAVTAEIFPANVRSVAAALTSCTCFLTIFIVCLICPLLFSHLGMAMSFFVFSLVCLTGSGFIYWVLPETKGKSVDEIQQLLLGN